MPKQSCFVIMPIGDQQLQGGTVTAAELKARYDDLMKEALLRAHPALEVVRADEVAAPGAITSDVITRIMHSDFVLADVTYPNPNVFYELGLRHACRLGTIIVRDRSGPRTPFDIAHLRHFEYENTSTGLKSLAADLEAYFNHRSQHPDHPDNQFQELAKLTHYAFPDYEERPGGDELQTEAMMAVMQAPELLELVMRSGSGQQVSQAEILQAMAKHPNVAKIFIQALSKS
jgi:hypothetical protein